MAKFEKAKGYEDLDFNLPTRKTFNSAGYDFEVIEDITIPTYSSQIRNMTEFVSQLPRNAGLIDMARFTKETGQRPTLIPTGVKCKLDPGTYLELVLRSSTPLKYWLVMANSVGIIDADYYGNPDNDGAMYFQVVNLGPRPIHLHKGDIIGQGIIHSFGITEDDDALGERTGGFGSTTK